MRPRGEGLGGVPVRPRGHTGSGGLCHPPTAVAQGQGCRMYAQKTESASDRSGDPCHPVAKVDILDHVGNTGRVLVCSSSFYSVTCGAEHVRI